jgi:subtilase family serine protease
MRLAQALAVVPGLAALSWGCGQDTAGPSAISESKKSLGGGDFEYIAQPPFKQMMALRPKPAIVFPFCGAGVICYTPQLIRAAYNFPGNLDGTGQTILLVEAFGSPTIRQDLADFDAVFGIPDPPSFTILCPDGCPTFNAHNPHGELGWSGETSLDVEYAHAMAPGANIVLVVAPTSSGNAIHSAEAKAIALYPGSIMSQSFGVPEIVVRGNRTQLDQAHKNYQAAEAAGMTVLAAAGDAGATNGFATANPWFPASDPLVTGVGGTQGDAYPGGLLGCGTSTCTGTYGGEQVWNEPSFLATPGATGGAPSAFFPVPSYQSGLNLTSRTVPDVAYNAAVNGGVLVVDATVAPGFFLLVGGTSVGTPQWAAIVALANQAKGAPLGFINPTLYQIGKCASNYAADFHDITVGNNQLAGTPLGFSAKSGYDFATGLGTPNVTNLVQDLVTPPSCP